MLEAIPKNLFSSNFRLEQQNRLVGEVDTSIWRDKAELELEEGSYQLFREGLMSGDFVLERAGKIIARASKPSVFENRFEVDLPGHHLVMRKLSFLSRHFGLFEGDKQIGKIYPLGIFTRHSRIDLPGEWPLSSRVFVFWLAFVVWKRQNAAAAS